mgnify:CR=1 FL=1
MGANAEKLKEVLSPLISEKETRIESFLEEDLEWYVTAVRAFHIEDKVIEYVNTHPNASAQELYRLIPEGSPDGEDEEE